MNTDTGFQIKFPIMPGTRHNSVGHFSAGEISAGVRAGIVQNNDFIGTACTKQRKFAPLMFEERPPVCSASAQFYNLDKGHDEA